MRSEIEALIYMLASCCLCIPHKKTTNKDGTERLWHNQRPSFVTKYWNPLETGNSSAIRMHLDRFLAGDQYLE